ncbi:hypothetical protein BO99DRAFT_25118 [Aspergillus violaceofuscus CBS 115571]|uniref:EthD domain-containing protein n=1 Tax=Aspergillus violaceofuscus (strain CBS 115571) TaxID=1450538 RepID=A0A2V5GYA7_ASPV1|nr:hypothetical protein BO99DRAFT_25118 [Aspergillus violaceofuscus CBS 115571]
MTQTAGRTERLLRLTIKLYKGQARQGGEGHDFARDYVVKAAKLHAKHGIYAYQQCYSPPAYRTFVDEMNRRNNRGWVIDDHDVTIEFYFRSFEELNKVNHDPEFQALQASEEPYVNRAHTVVSLSWIEKYVDNNEVVNIVDDKSTYPGYDELLDLSTALPTGSAAWVKKEE